MKLGQSWPVPVTFQCDWKFRIMNHIWASRCYSRMWPGVLSNGESGPRLFPHKKSWSPDRWLAMAIPSTIAAFQTLHWIFSRRAGRLRSSWWLHIFWRKSAPGHRLWLSFDMNYFMLYIQKTKCSTDVGTHMYNSFLVSGRLVFSTHASGGNERPMSYSHMKQVTCTGVVTLGSRLLGPSKPRAEIRKCAYFKPVNTEKLIFLCAVSSPSFFARSSFRIFILRWYHIW